MIYSKFRVKLVQKNMKVCYTCYKTKFFGEEAEMMEFGPLECSAKDIPASNPKSFKQFSWLANWHNESEKPPYGILKSDMVDRKLFQFTIKKAGEGNIRFGDQIFDENCVGMDKEKIVRSFRLIINSGGLKDFISVAFTPQLDTNIHSSKPPEEAPIGGVLFHFRKQILSWREGEKKLTQLLPLIGTNDKLHFILTSFKKVF